MEVDPSYIDSTLRFGFVLSYFTLGLGVPAFVTPSLIRNLPPAYLKSMQADELRNSPGVRELAEKCKESCTSAVSISFPSRGFGIATAWLSRISNSPPLMEWAFCWKDLEGTACRFLLEWRHGWPPSGTLAGLEDVTRAVDFLLFFNRVIDLFKCWTMRALVGTERLLGFTLSSPIEVLYVQASAADIDLISLRKGQFTLREDLCTYEGRNRLRRVLSRDELFARLIDFEAENRELKPARYIGAPRPRDRSPKRKGPTQTFE